MTENTLNNDQTISGATGMLLAGRYRVVRQLGQGGMGSVWLAEDAKLDGFKVAVKMLPSILVNNKRAYQQVKQEALVSLKLSHPNIATVRAFEEEGGSPFLVMDYIDGQTLDDYLAEKGKLSEDETIRLLKPVAAALDYAHAQGVVHRDVKPGNVMIRKDGVPFVLDFGIAREIQETMTRVTGKLSSGTLLYMSPEQLHGAAPKPAQDIYSFAAMAYECLTGAPPFSRGQIEYQIEHDTPAALDDGLSLAGGVMAGLAKSPEERPATCAAVFAAGLRTPCGRTEDGKPANNIWMTMMVLGVLALAGVGGWCWQRHNAEVQRQAEAVRQMELEQKRQQEVERQAETARQQAEAARIAEGKRLAEEKSREDENRIAAEKRERMRLELAAEPMAYALAAEMENAAQRIAREPDDVRAFFEAEIRAFEQSLKAGNDAKSDGRNVIATNFLTQAKAQGEALARLVEARSACLLARGRAVEARRSADAVGAEKILPLRYADAQRELVKASSLMAERKFSEASECIGSAAVKFAALRGEVIKVMLDEARRLLTAERWQDCIAKAEKVLGWEPTNSEALALKKVAEGHLVPTLCFVAKVGDREVPATATIGGVSYTSPWRWRVRDVKPDSRIPSSEVAVEYSEGDKRYMGTIKPVVVDWKGSKTIVVALMEYNEPACVQLWEGGPCWATCNVGATKPEECGYYFWWGDTVGYKLNASNSGWVSVKDGTPFSFNSLKGGICPTYGKRNSKLLSAGYIDSTGNLVAAHDAATAHLGAPWRMPTDAEFSALERNCDKKWTTRNGVNGYLVTGRGMYGSKSIFLPAAGNGDVSSLHDLGSLGYYWSSTPYSNHYFGYAWYLHFSSVRFNPSVDCRSLGRSVRPVRGFAK